MNENHYLFYQINGINGKFSINFHQKDSIDYICTRVKNEFGIIPKLTVKINDSELDSTEKILKHVEKQELFTFDVKQTAKGKPNLEMYRLPIITPRFQSKTTFKVFTTLNIKSMTTGNNIQIDIENDSISTIQNKIKEMIQKVYKNQISTKKVQEMKILLFLPGGVPFLKGHITEFIESFPDFQSHLYAVILNDKKITDILLNETFNSVCDISNEKKSLFSPDYESDISGLCEIAAVLGYIQNDGEKVKRMIYSLAKFCPFAPLISGLYGLLRRKCVTGRNIVQITAPLVTLFDYMAKNLTNNGAEKNLFSSTVKFMTYFMNIKVSNRVPCSEFVRPFDSEGEGKYFKDNFSDGEYSKVDRFVVFEPDLKKEDWIKFKIPILTDEDFEYSMHRTKTLKVVPPLSLREIHRVCLFQGLNGPWLYLSSSISKEVTEKDKIEYIDPEKGIVETDTYENVAIKTIGVDYKINPKLFDVKVVDTIDPLKVKQLVFICVDKSGSMASNFSNYFTRFEACFQLIEEFADSCYRYHIPSLFGVIMFNHFVEVRNHLNPIVSNFKERMIVKNERPTGNTQIFQALKKGAELLVNANANNKYPNAVLRLIVISDDDDDGSLNNIVDCSNFLLENKIRVDSVFIPDLISKNLFAISRFSGGFTIGIRGFDDGFNFFNDEDFTNPDNRKFGVIRNKPITLDELKQLPRVVMNDLDIKINKKLNEYTSAHKFVTSAKYALNEYEKEKNERIENNQLNQKSFQTHPNEKRIIKELRKIISNSDNDIKVYPIKNRIDVWRVLISGFEYSLYANKWFYLLVEFSTDYPQKYPNIRFVHPPFHPNITDQGRICMESLDQFYRSDISMLELISKIRLLLLEPNFVNPVDIKRSEMNGKTDLFLKLVKDWNEKNAKNSPGEWEREWKIQPDVDLVTEKVVSTIVPEQFLCPITRKIMNEPVKASSGVFYEKVALEKYVETKPNPTCKGITDKSGKSILLPYNSNINLPVDDQKKEQIEKWMNETDFLSEDDYEDSDDEDENIINFRKKSESITNPIYSIES